MLYLLSTSDPTTQAPFPQAAGLSGDGGPRIGEHAWNMLWGQLLAEEEAERYRLEYGFDIGSDEEEGDDEQLPPVPPIPSQHTKAQLQSEIMSAGMSSDEGGAAGSATSSDADPSTAAAAGQNGQPSLSASAAAQAALGRGMPSSTSPSGRSSRRIGSLPALSQRQTSRQSQRGAAVRNGLRSSSYLYSSVPPSATSSAYSHRSVSYSPSLFSSQNGAPAATALPVYGSSVVVGKVEFDVHASSRQGKWYESWLASANPSPVVEASPAPFAAGFSRSVEDSEPTRMPSSESRQQLRLPSMLAHQMNPVKRSGFVAQPFTFPRRPRDSDLSRAASSDDDGGETMSMMAGHGHAASPPEDLAEQMRPFGLPSIEDAGIVTPRPFHTRAASSVASRRDSIPSPERESTSRAQAEDSGYAPLDDGEDAVGLESTHVRNASTSSKSTFAGSDDGSRYGAGSSRTLPTADPLGDVFGSDEAVWRHIADDESLPRQRDAADPIVSTGLGITEASLIAGFPTAAGVAERPIQPSELPPQDDIADVAALLSPTSMSMPTASALLASPIRLDSSKEAADETGVFPSSSQAEKRASSFIPTHATRRSISTVNFTVRPPSTVASRSPEEQAQRTNRHGWTEIPAVVDGTMSASTSISSIAGLTEESVGAESATASTIGLERNLDELEQALAELSPARAPTATPATPAKAAELPVERSIDEASGHVTPSATPKEPVSPQPNSLLSSRPPFRYGFSVSSPQAEPSTLATAQEASRPSMEASDDAPVMESARLPAPTGLTVETSPDGRIPRSSSLQKPEPTEPHLVALPPSPNPSSTAFFPDEVQEVVASLREVPAIPSASPSWPEPTTLPFQVVSPKSSKTVTFEDDEESLKEEEIPPVVADRERPSENKGLSLGSSSPRLPALAPSVPAVPPPPADETSQEQATDASKASPGRSPNRLKKLRTGMWGSNRKAAEVPKDLPKMDAPKAAKEPAPEEATNGLKSPSLGSFFTRFGKKPRKSDGESFRRDVRIGQLAETTRMFAASTSAAETTDEDAPVVPSSASEITPAAIGYEAEAHSSSSVEDHQTEAPAVNEDDRVNVAGIGRVRTMSVASMRSPESPQVPHPRFPASLAAQALKASTQAPQIPTIPTSPATTATFTEQFDNFIARPSVVLSPTAKPFIPSFSPPATPQAVPRSDDSQASTSPSAFPVPPGPSSASRSAPVTPAAWTLATPRQRLRSKHRLSADIDQLLSQMHDIDFGPDDDAKEEMRKSLLGGAPSSEAASSLAREAVSAVSTTSESARGGDKPVSPVGAGTSLAYDASASSTSPQLELTTLKLSPQSATNGVAGADESAERPSSADLVTLGAIMTANLA